MVEGLGFGERERHRGGEGVGGMRAEGEGWGQVSPVAEGTRKTPIHTPTGEHTIA